MYQNFKRSIKNQRLRFFILVKNALSFFITFLFLFFLGLESYWFIYKYIMFSKAIKKRGNPSVLYNSFIITSIWG